MYNRDEIEKLLTLDYTDIVSGTTNRMRKYNIDNLIEIIIKDIKDNNLEYGKKERRIKIYSTSQNEHIYIQYPGSYSKINKSGVSKVPFDFRPIAVLKNNGKSKDMDFESIWRILQNFIEGHRNLMGIINTLLFRMGRMYEYLLVENQNYKSYFIENGKDERPTPAEHMAVPLYKLNFQDDELIQSLNYLAENIDAGSGETMSLEAFLYYFELLLQIEDCKYNSDKISDHSGRIPSSDSMIVISSYSNNQIDLANMLMRFVRYRGIARCENDEYGKVTQEIVKITNVKNHIEELCQENNITFTKARKFKIDKNDIIQIKLKIDEKRIIIMNDAISKEQYDKIKKLNWNVFNLNDYLGTEKQKELDNLILNTTI